MSQWQAVFVDRDGTIGGTGRFIHPKDFLLYEGSKDSIFALKKSGLKVFAFTNQHRISGGEASEADFREQFKLFGFDDAFICSHESYEDCSCRKPKPGMLLAAAAKYNLNLTKCIVIGDVGDTDMLAAQSVGATKIIVRTGWGESSLSTHRFGWKNVEPDYIAVNFNEAVKWVLDRQ